MFDHTKQYSVYCIFTTQSYFIMSILDTSEPLITRNTDMIQGIRSNSNLRCHTSTGGRRCENRRVCVRKEKRSEALPKRIANTIFVWAHASHAKNPPPLTPCFHY